MAYIDTAPPHAETDTVPAELSEGGLAAICELFDALEGEQLQSMLVEFAAGLLDSFRDNPITAFAQLGGMPLKPAHAILVCDILTDSFFPEGRQDVATLEEGAALLFIGFLIAAGRRQDALSALDRAEPMLEEPRFRSASLIARGMALGVKSIADLWLPCDDPHATIEAARAAVEARELDIRAHRSLVRRTAEAEGLAAGLSALCTALTLPVGTADRLPLAEDLAAIIALLHARSDIDTLDQARVQLALRANPASAMSALSLLSGDHLFVRLAGPAAVTEASRFLHGFANPVDPRVRSPYPFLNGKPRVETVWLEITNFCNQKCTFCPDMHREDSRQWLPLAEVKRLIDELAETVSVGSMQLNAYGEPLLHPHIQEILAYINEKKLPWPTFFTTHGMTLVPKKLAQLSNNYPAGIALSLHNDSQESYAATRSAKLGDYDQLVSRTSDLLRQMVMERAPCHMRLYQMVSNGAEDMRVDPKVRGAFPDSPARMGAHVRKWEKIAAEIAAAAPPEAEARVLVNSDKAIADAFLSASHGEPNHLRVLEWRDVHGALQHAFMSPRPVGTYANLLLEYHPDWQVERRVVNRNRCGFVGTPSLAIFATRKLGICCLDLNSTGTFGSLDDYSGIAAALTSPEASRMFAQVANGVATSRGCQICLGEGRQLCAK